MPSPFPGMDPYLERRNVWPDVHGALIVATQDALAPQVAPVYYVAIEERMYIGALDSAEFIGRPDVAIITAPIEARPASQDVCFTNSLPVLQSCPWERRAPARLQKPRWSPALPGGGHWRRTYEMDI